MSQLGDFWLIVITICGVCVSWGIMRTQVKQMLNRIKTLEDECVRRQEIAEMKSDIKLILVHLLRRR